MKHNFRLQLFVLMFFSAILLGLSNVAYAATGLDWTAKTIQSSGDVGGESSIAIGPDNTIHIIYYDDTNGNLRYAKKTPTSTSWSLQTIDSNGDVGAQSSIVLDSSGQPHVAYLDTTNGNLKYAKLTSSGWKISTVASTGLVGDWPSIDLDSNNRPHISYYDITNQAIKYVKMTSTGAWSFKTIDSTNRLHSSLALDKYDRPRILYEDTTGLGYAKVTSSGSWLVSKVVSSGANPSIAIDSDGRTNFSYKSSGLKYAHRDSAGTWHFASVDTSSSCTGAHSSLVLDSKDIPHIAYSDDCSLSGNHMKYATHSEGKWQIDIIGYHAVTGDLALDKNNLPNVSYNSIIVTDPEFEDTDSNLLYTKGS
jgi:hypothetical protein